MQLETGLPHLRGRLQAIAVLAEDMVDRSVKAVQAYSEHDTGKAQQLISQDDQMDSLNKFYQEELVEMMLYDSAAISNYLQLGVIAKRLERVADHAINIAEDVLIIGKEADAL